MRAVLSMSALLVLFLGLSNTPIDAGDKQQDFLVGKWKMVDSKNNKAVEFTKDGKMIVSTTNASGKTLTGTNAYKFIAEDKLELTVDVLGKKVIQTLKVVVSKDELATTNDFGGIEKYKRTK